MKYFFIMFFLTTGFLFAGNNPLDDYENMDNSYQGLLKDKMAELEKVSKEKGIDLNLEEKSEGFDTNYLFASLFWGLIASGYFMWGKKAGRLEGMLIGLIIGVCSYLCTALVMSLVSIGIIFCFHYFEIELF